jgi:LysM repeat protein
VVGGLRRLGRSTGCQTAGALESCAAADPCPANRYSDAVDSPTPVVSPAPQTGRTYTVQPGDELKEIAATYHVTVWQIIDANSIPNPDSLKVGQVLRIPDS